MLDLARRRVLAGVLLLPLMAGAARSGTAVDLELVLAVDASGSVDDAEFSLQLSGIGAAFRDAEVVAAIRRGRERRIAVNLLVWADHQAPKDTSGWAIVGSAAEASTFAATVEHFARTQNGATGIGEGIAAALRSMDDNGIDATRKVVDVSGDGRETTARDYVVMLPEARAMAYERGVTVNGLAITNEEPDLLSYYDNAVREGPGSFAMEARDYRAFAAAMRRKLLREIGDQPVAGRAPAGTTAAR